MYIKNSVQLTIARYCIIVVVHSKFVSVKPSCLKKVRRAQTLYATIDDHLEVGSFHMETVPGKTVRFMIASVYVGYLVYIICQTV